MSPKSTTPFSQCYCGTLVQRYTVQAIFLRSSQQNFALQLGCKKLQKTMFFVWWFRGFFVPLHCSSKTREIQHKKFNTKTKLKELWH